MSEADITNGFQKVTHCIFDMDGLLLDTEPIYEEIVRQISSVFGKTYPFDVRMKMLGTSEQRSAQIAVDDLGLPITVDEYFIRYNKLCREMLGKAQLLPGAERLVRHLHAKKVPIALATSSGEQMVQIKIKNYQELFSLFNHHVCGSTDPEIKEGKPSPEIFLVAAKRFPDDPDPANCLVFEDAPNGVRAAHSAGMRSVIVPDPNTPPESYKLATKVLKSLNDFKPEEFGLPAFPES